MPKATTPPPQNSPARMPAKQKMGSSLKSLMSSFKRRGTSGGGIDGGGQSSTMAELFVKTDPATDGEECLHDCDSCTVRYPRSFKVEEDDLLYGQVKGWSTHLVVGTGKTDWVRDVGDEKGSVMEAVNNADGPENGRLMLSASNLPTPHGTCDYSEPTTILLLPAFTLIHNVHPNNVKTLMKEIINVAPTTSSPLTPSIIPASIPSSINSSNAPPLLSQSCPHSAVILMCSQKTRDARCGQSAPLLRKEFERHLRPLGLYRDLQDERPGGVGIYFTSHTGGHKYSANVMIYRRPNAFGQDEVAEIEGVNGKGTVSNETKETKSGANGDVSQDGTINQAEGDVGAGQGIWLARVRPEDCENLVRYTVLKGKVVKPERQLRGGFDRSRGLISW